MHIRTRFAPSPTGYLHIGGARTALYGWLFAKKHQGTFILRIEDTDLERSTPDSVQAILDAMQWLELDYEEGPFYQTQRFGRYAEVAQQLLAQGKAYRCYCSKERLENLREQQRLKKQKPRYDGHCRNLASSPANQPFVVRFRNPETGFVAFDDQVYGALNFANHELDDLVIVRSDDTPTYNFTVVVDDWDMKITHVIRGDDHINNTPRQINILKSLGAELPIYAHVPMILGNDGKRLSKRHGAVSVMQYRDQGILPDALLNYLVRLGWSHADQEIFSRKEMIHYFELNAVNRAPAAFNPEKLLWLNQHYLKNSDPASIAGHLAWLMEKQQMPIANGPALTDLIAAQAERSKTLLDMVEKSQFFYKDVTTYDEKAANKHLTPDIIPLFEQLIRVFQTMLWQKETIHAAVQDVAESHQLALGKVAQPLRVAVTGNTISPPIDITLALLGKEKTLKRLEKALEWVINVRSLPAV
jgi:glutamyl-tRNA synthetase